ncbi:unnamed protein product [Pylaiella littoralis]
MRLPHRGYEPVDDGGDEDPANVHMANPTGHEDRNSAERERSALPTSPGADSEATTAAASPAPAPAARAASSTTSDGADRFTEKCSAGNVEDANGDEDDGRMAVRILDVRGQFYPLRVRPETTVGELKLMLVDATGVELVRQRIIHGGKMLGDSDTLASRKISDGSAVHLFQKPKIAPSAVTPSSSSGGLSTASAQQPGRLHEFPPVLMDRGRGGLGGGSGAMGRPDWEVEGPRKQIRCLASFLLLISIIQLLECVASMSAVIGSSGAAGRGGDSGGSSNAHTEIPDEYWVLLRGRSVASLMGIVVGMLGVRGSQSLNTQTIKMYYVGLVMCAVVSIVIRIEVLFDIIAGRIPFGDYGLGSPSSSDDQDGGTGGGGAGGGGGDPGTRGGGGGGATAQEAQNSLVFAAFSAFVSVLVAGAVWLLCIRRVNAMRGQIYEHIHAWERHERGEELEGIGGGGGFINAVSDPELEGRRRGTAAIV